MEQYVKKFFDEIVKSKDFDGNYFKAMCNAIVLARSYSFIKSMKGVNFNERKNL